MKKYLVLIVLLSLLPKVYSQEDSITMKDIKRNSIYVENLVIFPSIHYDRILPVSKRAGVVLKVGAFHYAGWAFTGEVSMLLGGTKHFFEPGVGFEADLNFHSHLGYRYMGPKGLLLKGGIHIVKNVPVFPTFGLGISF